MKIAVGLSGGVDSAVAALLCKKQGHEVIGVMMKIWDGRISHKQSHVPRDACFGPEEHRDIEDAQRVCEELGIPLHIIDCADEFHSRIIDYISKTYLAGKTPNPCVYCNQQLKFGLLPEQLFKKVPDVDRFATGHYAQLKHEPDGEVHLLRASQHQKDQSYFLHRLTKEQLGKVLFPIGHLTKAQVREIALQGDLHVWNKLESQDFYSGDYRDLINQSETGAVQGDIISVHGTRLGTHNGIWNYTIGQRKGLGLSSAEPLYVIEINQDTNTVVVGSQQELIRSEILVEDFNQLEEFPEEVSCKIRSSSPVYSCSVTFLSPSTLSVKFSSSIQSASPGQSAVFYSKDLVLGGGIIA
jgi:tRNA-specific 2-thiouridylase